MYIARTGNSSVLAMSYDAGHYGLTEHVNHLAADLT